MQYINNQTYCIKLIKEMYINIKCNSTISSLVHKINSLPQNLFLEYMTNAHVMKYELIQKHVNTKYLNICI